MQQAYRLRQLASCTFFSTISEKFVCKKLKKIKTSKSTGLANTPARLLKDGCNALAKPLAILMNKSLAEGATPTNWKDAMVTPVLKSVQKRTLQTIDRSRYCRLL